jgi:hypothetical protein
MKRMLFVIIICVFLTGSGVGKGAQQTAPLHIIIIMVCRSPAFPPSRISVSKIAHQWPDRGRR